MSKTRPLCCLVPGASCRHRTQRGYTLLITLFLVGTIGTMLLMYQLGNSRNDRYQIYYALGQEYALMARAAHVYVQDHAYYSPYKNGAGAEQTAWFNYYEGLKTTKIAAYREPLDNQTNPADNLITLKDMQTSGVVYAGADVSMHFNKPVRGVTYEFSAHGGLVPLHAPASLQASSALFVMNGKSSGSVDLRTAADMAAFRSGAASNGLNRIGIVLDPTVGKAPPCRGGTSIVSWGTTASDCLTAADAAKIGITLKKFDVVAPAWEAVEKQLTTKLVYRRPHPGLQGMNVMQQDLQMDDGNKYNIADVNEIYTDTVNIDDATDKNLFVGNIDPTTGMPPSGATADDAILTVARGHNTLSSYAHTGDDRDRGPDVCNSADPTVTACFAEDMDIEENLAVSFRQEERLDVYPKIVLDENEAMLTVDGIAKVEKGNVIVNSEDSDTERGFFDVSNKDGTAHAVFTINKQDGNSDTGTVINKKVNVKSFNVAGDTNSENFIVDKDFNIIGGNVKIGTASTPAKMVLTTAPLASSTGTKLDISTVGKAALPGTPPVTNGVYSTDVETGDLTQTGSKPMKFDRVTFQNITGSKPAKVTVGNRINVDPQGKNPNNDCVGEACPDHIKKDPTGAPL